MIELNLQPFSPPWNLVVEVRGGVGSFNPLIMWLFFLVTSPHYESPRERTEDSKFHEF